MYKQPLFLEPILQERIWGGNSLERFDYELPSNIIGECWGISAHPNGSNNVKNGIYKGMGLANLWIEHKELFGNNPSLKFPLLTKILDANKDLSVQVHPNDQFARIYEKGELGKTECWYIIDCKDGAEIIYGHYAQTKEEFAELIKEKEWHKLLRKIEIKPGDFFYVPSGTIHALGEGTLVLETQQNSDTTYRVYDYDRKDQEGNVRELHLEKAYEVSQVPHIDYNITKEKNEIDGAIVTTYIQEKYFSVYKWEIKKEATFEQERDFQLVSVINGTGILTTIEGNFQIKKGDHFILPYGMGEFVIKGNVTAIVSHT
ncbi:mannose-6-phosphate isomerase, class I [Bacillus cereus]